MKPDWGLRDVPDLEGKTFLVTGANDGLGLCMTRAMVEKGARVLMACRNVEKAHAARRDLLADRPRAALDVVAIDLAALESVRAAATAVRDTVKRLDGVLCNAGLMAIPFQLTEDGLEMQMGVNYYGHYALVGHLMPLIRRSPGVRVVTTSSAAERLGRLRLDHPPTRASYRRWGAYCDSKLAVLMLALILDRKFRAEGVDAIALSGHPGFAKTNIRKTRLRSETNAWIRFQMAAFERMSFPAERGMLPLLYAATDPHARSGDYMGLTGFFEARGWPKVSRGQKRAYDHELQGRLWESSAQLTGVRY